ncbi:MAG TPA: tyrosine-type recombinase/integrase [Chitinophagaceae bacterium]
MTTKTNRQLLLIPLFQKFITASATGRRVTPSGKRLSKGATIQYQCVCKLLQEFEKIHAAGPLRVKLIHRSSLRQLQSEKLYWQRFFRKFTGWLYQEKNYYDQYMGSVSKVLRTFFNYLLNEKCMPIGNFHKQFIVPAQKITPIVLDPQQLNFLITDSAFHDSLPGFLQRTKDIFVVGCTVGLRYGDLMKLKKQDIQFTPSGTYMLLNTTKTASEVKIPLPSYVTKIIHKYFKHTGRHVLPRLSGTNINLQLKMLMERAGWTYSLPKIRYRQGKAIELKNTKEQCFRFCDHITAHTMRRTAITTLLLLGVEETMVRRISGHAPGSKEFYKYVAVVQDYLDEKVKFAHQKLLEINTKKAA